MKKNMKISYDLSSIIALTAGGIDNHINGRASNEDYDRIKKLSDDLYKDSKRDYLDPTMQVMYAELFWKDKKDWKGKKQKYVQEEMNLSGVPPTLMESYRNNQRDLQEKINNFSNELLVLTRLTTSRQEYLKNTCLELSRIMRAMKDMD